ncbi:hypothetical protein ACOSQ3_020339 [Xanthoceras sorbifolium]
MEEHLKILYNVFGFCVQFLPLIMEHIGASRRNIEKIRNLVQKYTKLQQQPAILILNCEMAQKGLRTVSLQSPKAPNEISGDSVGLLKDVLGLAQFSDKERPMWYSKWRKKNLASFDAKGIAQDSTNLKLYIQSLNGLFLQPCYDAQHLLLAHSRLPHAAPTAAAPSEFQGSLDGTMDTEWKAVKKAWHQCSFCNGFA